MMSEWLCPFERASEAKYVLLVRTFFAALASAVVFLIKLQCDIFTHPIPPYYYYVFNSFL